METFLPVNLDTINDSQPSIMNIVCRWDVMISLLMTAMETGYVVVIMKMDIMKEAFMVGKRFSMVVTLDVKQLNKSVEKMFARLQRIIPPLLLLHHSLQFQALLQLLPFHRP